MTEQHDYGIGGNRASSQYYHHTNTVEPAGFILGASGGLAVGLFAAIVYAYVIVYIPLIYPRVIVPFIFGLALGLVPAKIMRWGKVRNVPIVIGVVGIIAVLSYALHWFVWIFALLNRDESIISWNELLAHPAVLPVAIGQAYEHGSWGMTSHEPINGIQLGIIWLIEAGIIFGTAYFVARKLQTSEPFCEACDDWCPQGKRVRSLRMSDYAELKRRMEMGDWAYFDEVGPPRENAVTYISIIHHQCPACGTLHTLSANAIEGWVDSRGHEHTGVKCIVDKLLASPEDVEAAKSSGSKPGLAHDDEIGL